MTQQFTEDSANDTSQSGAVAAQRSADGVALGVASPTLVDDQGDIGADMLQPSSLGEDQQKTWDELSEDRQVIRDGQVVFGAEPPKPKPLLSSSSSTEVDINGIPLGKLPEGDAGAVIAWARKALGTPYVWGGNSIGKGLDCSGLVQQAFKAIGINLPRVSADQVRAGKRISTKDLRPGDLVAWDNSSRNNGADHIGIYIGGGKFIEAPRAGRNVQISSLKSRPGVIAVRILK